MNLTTLSVDPEVAKEKVREYRGLDITQRRKEDADFRRVWRILAKGLPILNVESAFRQTGLNEQGLPKLAMARADWQSVRYSSGQVCFFSAQGRWRPKRQTDRFDLPSMTFSGQDRRDGKVDVPTIPPKLRPKDDLQNYWILFEALNWQEYPADPFLLKHITGYIYAVLGEWDLTELERQILSAILH